MADWTLLVADTDGTIRGEWVRARSIKASWDLHGPATVTWESDGDDPGAMLAHEITSDLMLYRDDQLMFRGRCGTTGDSGDADRHTVTWAAVDYRGMLDVRLTRGNNYVQQDQTYIGWNLIAWAKFETGGNIPITDSSTPTGRLRDRTYEWGKPIGEAITQLSEVIDGFDWEVGPDLKYRTWYPQRGSLRTWPAVVGDTIQEWQRTVDTGQYATDIWAVGGEVNGAPLRATASIVGPHGPGGRWDRLVTYSDVTVQTTLDEHADAAVADASVIRPSYVLTPKLDAWTPDDAWLGDTTRIVIQSGRLDVDTTGRIVAISIDIDDAGGVERPVLTYGRRPADLADRLLTMRDNLAALSRR